MSLLSLLIEVLKVLLTPKLLNGIVYFVWYCFFSLVFDHLFFYTASFCPHNIIIAFRINNNILDISCSVPKFKAIPNIGFLYMDVIPGWPRNMSYSSIWSKSDTCFTVYLMIWRYSISYVISLLMLLTGFVRLWNWSPESEGTGRLNVFTRLLKVLFVP